MGQIKIISMDEHLKTLKEMHMEELERGKNHSGQNYRAEALYVAIKTIERCGHL